MRILHGIHNIGGMAGLLARTQRELGHEAISYCNPTGSFRFEVDRTFRYSSRIARAFEAARFFLLEGHGFDCFHFYFGSSLAGPALWDVPFLREAGKRVFFYFCGCDIRDSKHVAATYEISACRTCWPMLCSRNQQRAQRVAIRHADGVFVSTPDLLEFVPGSVLLPQPLDFEAFARISRAVSASRGSGADAARPEEPRGGRRVRVVHAPTNRVIKGTAILEEAMRLLQARGVPVELVLVEQKSHAEALSIFATCDLAVDQLLIGSYGQFAVETMALGKPTICFLREDLRDFYPGDCPVIPASPRDIADVIALWALHPEWWEERGRAGMEYVRRVHDHRAIARRCLEVYAGRRAG